MTGGAILDHTGQNLYVLLQWAIGSCIAYQTYDITKATGALKFAGGAVASELAPGSLPTITANSQSNEQRMRSALP